MKMLRFIHRVGEILFGDGKERKKYAIESIVHLLLSLLFAYFTVKLLALSKSDEITSESIAKFLGCWILLFCCIASTAFFLFWGVLSQILVFVCAFFCLWNKEKREGNVAAFVITGISLLAAVAAFCVLFFVIL